MTDARAGLKKFIAVAFHRLMDRALIKVHGVDGNAHFAAARDWVGESDLEKDSRLFRAVVTLQGSSKSTMSVFFAGLLAETIETRGSSTYLRFQIIRNELSQQIISLQFELL